MKLSDFHIKIDVELYGTIELIGLVLKDMSWLDNVQTKELPARTFAVDLIQSHLVSPTLDAKVISGWSDDLLISVANSWLKDQQYDRTVTFSPALSFDDFKQAVYRCYDELTEGTRELLDAVTTNLKGIVSPILTDM